MTWSYLKKSAGVCFVVLISPHALAVELPPVSIGGVSGLASIADPKSTERLRSIGVGFYLHYTASDPSMFGALDKKIASIFREKPISAELSLGGGFNPGFWKTFWKTQVLAYGFHPSIVYINIDIGDAKSPSSIDESVVKLFKEFVAAGRKETDLKAFAPLFAPNSSGGRGSEGDASTVAVIHPWADAWWDPVREVSEYGGAIALDSPPAFFLHGLPNTRQVNAYQMFDIDVMRWSFDHNLPSTIVLSPFFDPARFLEDAQTMYDFLLQARALPSSWVAENYNACDYPFAYRCQPTDAAFGTPIGTERDAETVAGVALWFATSAKVRVAR